MSVRREKLALALELAKQRLNQSESGIDRVSTPPKNEEKSRSKSKMNRILGNDVKDQRGSTLLQRTGVAQRPTFDLVADNVLGKESKRRSPAIDLRSTGDSLSDIAARRIRSLRQRTYDQIEEVVEEEEIGFLGLEEDGRPIWERILDEQRGRVSHALPEEIAPVDNSSPFHHDVVIPVEGQWPTRLRADIRMSFKQWFTTEENIRATQAAEAIVDSPGGQLNPMLFIGPPETGRSHLLHAISQAILRRQEGGVYLLSATDFSGMEQLPIGWQDTLVNARLLAIDDIHECADNADLAHEIGTMLDYALNMGVHVLLSSQSEPDTWPTSRLWELTRHAAAVKIGSPKVASMILYARNLAQKKGYIFDDAQLKSIVLQDNIGWRATKANFDLVALAVDSGQEIVDGQDVYSLLSNQSLDTTEVAPSVQEKVEDIASRLISTAVDTVYSDTVHGGIDLYSELPEVGDDAYQPPDFDIDSMRKQADARHAAHLKFALEDTAPAASSVLALHEREEHLIARKGKIEQRDYGLAADVLTELDEAFDSQINAFENELRESSMQLANIENKLVNLSERTPDASMDELISIADELRSMEQSLTEFDPEREPWPDMEPDELSKKSRRKVGRRKSNSNNEALESHDPEGEWNIDAKSVDMLDLLDDQEDTRLIRLARMKQITTLVSGEEE